MSKPTPERITQHEHKRAEERKLMRTMTSAEWDKRKAEIKERVKQEGLASKSPDLLKKTKTKEGE
jgi:hypothetical protein